MKMKFDGSSRKARRAIEARPPEGKAPIRFELFDPQDVSFSGPAEQEVFGLTRDLSRLVDSMPPADLAAKVGPGAIPMPPSEGKVRRRNEGPARLVDSMPPVEHAAKVGGMTQVPVPSEGKVRRRK